MPLLKIGPGKFDPKSGPPCHLCTARCCKYFALEIDTPVTPEDHDSIRWYLLHEHVVVWVQDKAWYLEVRTPCRHLLADNRCAIYETRPRICREYGWPQADEPENAEEPCEYFSGEGGYDLFFDSAESFETWSAAALAKRAARLARRRERYRRARTEADPARKSAIA